jgi:hypothetical protein
VIKQGKQRVYNLEAEKAMLDELQGERTSDKTP